MLTREQLIATLDAHTEWRACEDVPEIHAWHARDETELWRALEDVAGARVEVPYFAIPWPSARVMARAILDATFAVRETRVVDVGCGSGVLACAAALAGARTVLAVDVDPHATMAAAELARRNGAERVEARALDVLAQPSVIDVGADGLVICADLVSREQHVAPFARAVDAWRARGARVVLVDSGRPFFRAPPDASLVLERVVRADAGVDGAETRVVRAFLANGAR